MAFSGGKDTKRILKKKRLYVGLAVFLFCAYYLMGSPQPSQNEVLSTSGVVAATTTAVAGGVVEEAPATAVAGGVMPSTPVTTMTPPAATSVASTVSSPAVKSVAAASEGKQTVGGEVGIPACKQHGPSRKTIAPIVASVDCVPKEGAPRGGENLEDMRTALKEYHQCRFEEVAHLHKYEAGLEAMGRTPWSRQAEPVCGMLAEERTLEVTGNECPATVLQVKQAIVECGRVVDDVKGINPAKHNPTASQNGQDKAIMAEFFSNPDHQPKRAFVYADLGSNMPMDLSNTWAMDIKHGWKGVCVEANPEYHEWTAATRTCRLLRVAAGGETPSTAMFQFSGVLGGLTSELDTEGRMDRIEQEATEEGTDRGFHNSYRMTRTKVQVMPLKDIVQASIEHTGVSEVDFMDIDVEGAEVFCLGKHDFSKVPIHVISIEIEDSKRRDEVDAILLHQGYLVKDIDGMGTDVVYYRKCGPWEGQLPLTHAAC